MESFSRRKKIQETETLIKESLLQQLSFSVKEIQLLISKKNEVFSTNEESNSLVTILEAIFLHGMKRGILKIAMKAVAGEEEYKPQPSFWNMVCNYTHKNSVITIKRLPQVKTDVGRSRVWIRMALNEGELTSYFAAMKNDRKALNNSYSIHAFLRDRETCDTACKLLEGISSVQFEIPINSSILNSWNSEPLMLSGVWLPPMKTPLGKGVDVAEKIEDDYDEDDSCSIKTSSSITTLSSILALDESQALKMILETPVIKMVKEQMMPICPDPPSLHEECSDLILKEEDEEQSQIWKEQEVEGQAGRGNSIANAHGWSSTDEIIPSPEANVPEANAPEANVEFKAEEYSTLLEKVGISLSKKINYETQLEEVMKKQKDLSFAPSENSNSFNSYTSKLYKIVREMGLKAQKYICAGCQLSIGLTFGEARLCHFTGEYYCGKCHLNESCVIPSRLIFNWDHKKYPVCTNVYKYLNDISDRLFIDIKTVNPKLYSAVREMRDLREIRVQLNVLRAYFYTCKESLLLDLQKKLAPREYLYEFIDHYAVSDLCQVPGGVLAAELTAIISIGRNHVVGCSLCHQKGFICEICKAPEVIYPFDVSTTYRCSKCYSLYHNTCLSSSKNCPKCKRLKSRSSPQMEE